MYERNGMNTDATDTGRAQLLKSACIAPRAPDMAGTAPSSLTDRIEGMLGSAISAAHDTISSQNELQYKLFGPSPEAPGAPMSAQVEKDPQSFDERAMVRLRTLLELLDVVRSNAYRAQNRL